MKLRVLLPTEVLLDETVVKVIAEAEDGCFCIEPRHVDFVATLVPGLLFYHTETGGERVFGVDEGVLVKCADEVLVSTRNAVRGTDLAGLRQAVEQQFKHLDDAERVARSALSRLEAGLLRRFSGLKE